MTLGPPVGPGKRSPARPCAARGRFRKPHTPYAAVRTSPRVRASSPASGKQIAGRKVPVRAGQADSQPEAKM